MRPWILDHAERSVGFISQHAQLSGPLEPQWDWSSVRAVVLREAQRTLGHTASAQDAAQEALLRAWRYQWRCRARHRPDAWLRAIARREALRILARTPACESLDGVDPVVEDHAEWEASRTDVARAVGRLPAHERDVVLRHYWRDMTCEEIAGELACPTGTVKIRLHRARGRLARLLGPV